MYLWEKSKTQKEKKIFYFYFSSFVSSLYNISVKSLQQYFETLLTKQVLFFVSICLLICILSISYLTVLFQSLIFPLILVLTLCFFFLFKWLWNKKRDLKILATTCVVAVVVGGGGDGIAVSFSSSNCCRLVEVLLQLWLLLSFCRPVEEPPKKQCVFLFKKKKKTYAIFL